MAIGPIFERPELLLHPPVPMPLHGVNPRTIMGGKWWEQTRYISYEKNNRHCWACIRKRDRLEAHECYDIDYEYGTATLDEVVALCSTCHHFIHSNRLVRMVEAGIYVESIYLAVRAHGYRVLAKAGLDPSPWARRNFEPDYEIPTELLTLPMATWNDWRMIVEGNDHASLFKDRATYDAHYEEENRKKLEAMQ